MTFMRPNEGFEWLPYSWATAGAAAGVRSMTTKSPKEFVLKLETKVMAGSDGKSFDEYLLDRIGDLRTK